jgi:hypothetical protein
VQGLFPQMRGILLRAAKLLSNSLRREAMVAIGCNGVQKLSALRGFGLRAKVTEVVIDGTLPNFPLYHPPAAFPPSLISQETCHDQVKIAILFFSRFRNVRLVVFRARRARSGCGKQLSWK